MTSQVEAIDLNPLHYLGDAASQAVGDVWKAAMIGLWSAALWLLKLAFRIIDAFSTPNLSPSGPIGAVLPSTLWIGATLAAMMMFVQLSVALVRRDGQSLGRVLLGVGQFGLVWVACLGVAAGLVAAAAGLERGILRGMLHVDSMSGIDLSQAWPDKITDVTLATVLGVLSLLVVIPAAFFYLVIMFVREAALIILVATAPISAGGLTSDTGRVWFWKTLRWFFACLLIAPCAALLLGVGVRLSSGVITPPQPPSCAPHCSVSQLKQVGDYANQLNTAQAGMAVIGCLVIAIGACCPLVLFRLLAFVEPGTASGAALRQSWSDAGGVSGLLSGGRGDSEPGGSAATSSGGDGRSGGEGGAEAQTQSRLTSALGAVGAGMQVATRVAHRAADIGSEVLGQAGVGSPGYSMPPNDERGSSRRSARRPAARADAAGPDQGGGTAPPEPPLPPIPPMPPMPPMPPTPGTDGPTAMPGASAGPQGGPGAAGGAVGGGEAAGAAVIV